MSAAAQLRLPVAELTAAAFAPFGQVIECAGRSSLPVNAASSQRFNDLAQLEADADGRLALSIFRAKARAFPFTLDTLECHPFGSQAFVPLHGQAFLVVVASARPDPQRIEASALQVFVSQHGQGVNFRRGVWHHPLLALTDGDFLVADRLGPGNNCQEIDITHWQLGIDH